jgi:hypothetical protein
VGAVSNESAGNVGYTRCQFGTPEERVQPRGEHESQNDSVYFNFVAPPESSIYGGVIRVGLRPNDGYTESSLVMPRRDGTVLFHYKRVPVSPEEHPEGDSMWRSGPMSLGATQPTKSWRLRYASGDSRIVRDPRAFGEDPGGTWRASDPIATEFDFAWTGDFPMHVLSAGGNLMPGNHEITYGKNHYEQFGRLSGELSVGGEEYLISDAPAFRDHSWGPRVWESAPNQDFVSIYLDDGRRIVAVSNRVDGRTDWHGVALIPGRDEPVQLERYELHSSYSGEPAPEGSMGWSLRAGDDAIEIAGDVEAYMPLRVGKSPVRIAQTMLKLTGPLTGRAKTDLTRPIAGG